MKKFEHMCARMCGLLDGECKMVYVKTMCILFIKITSYRSIKYK